MGRIHLFEFEDQSWFPEFLRTDFLQFLSNKTKMYKPIISIIVTRPIFYFEKSYYHSPIPNKLINLVA